MFIAVCVVFCREREEEEALEHARRAQQEQQEQERQRQSEKLFAQKERERQREQDRRRRAAVSDSLLYSVLVSISCPKTLYQLGSDNIIHITVVVVDLLGLKSISP